MIKHLSLSNRISDYLNHVSPERLVIRETLNEVSTRLPNTAIFGGMIREFALGNAREFSSDIDLVAFASHHEIYQAIKEFNPDRNKFGGFRFIVGKQLYDIWAFDDTWAFREGIIKGNVFKDLLDTTFFNLDAALFNLDESVCYVSDSYQTWLDDHLLDLNLQENPAPANMARRAINMAINQNLAIGPKLGLFLISQKINTPTDLISDMFLFGLKKHLEKNDSAQYFFQPQMSLLA
ncbi:MAG: hypothetical protein ACKVN9_07055 [Methylophilaceae bacterium]